MDDCLKRRIRLYGLVKGIFAGYVLDDGEVEFAVGGGALVGGSDLVCFCLGADGRDDGVTVVSFYSRVST